MPLLKMTGVRREYPAGEGTVAVLGGIDLEIDQGEFVAIVGASGSGKSTLMNIFGCLDRPTSGVYRVDGRATHELSPDELAALRRDHFGFIFQRYHLLSHLSALGNVETPAVYAGGDALVRRERAEALLNRLGLGQRMHHRPAQLSGGQQQRVSIARALMNGGAVILADEPTGALDKASGEEVMRILEQLNGEGHTIILVTHDPVIAARARRVIRIADGLIVADDRPDDGPAPAARSPTARAPVRWRSSAEAVGEALRMALLAMNAHRIRTSLTMLGIIIGIASVVSVVGLGKGAQEKVLRQISELGTNTIDVYPGKDFGDPRAAAIQTLSLADARALARQPYVDSVTPGAWASITARARNLTVNAQVAGVSGEYFRVRGLRTASGRLFGVAEDRRTAQVAVIDSRAQAALFPNGMDPLGAFVLLGTMPVRVIGTLNPSSAGSLGDSTPTIYVPYSAAATRLLGKTHLQSITVRIKDEVSSAEAQQAVTALLTDRHRLKDFFVFNADKIRQTITGATQALTLLISAIAVIALLVGGIGVMNIMLVSVAERTREIGVRVAVGARRSDILQQFLVEAVLVCLLGGAIGVIAALVLGALVNSSGGAVRMVFSPPSFIFAFVCSTTVGVLFGFLPARNAARLDPVEALARD